MLYLILKELPITTFPNLFYLTSVTVNNFFTSLGGSNERSEFANNLISYLINSSSSKAFPRINNFF